MYVSQLPAYFVRQLYPKCLLERWWYATNNDKSDKDDVSLSPVMGLTYREPGKSPPKKRSMGAQEWRGWWE